MTTREKASRELATALDDKVLKALADPTRRDIARHLLVKGAADIAAIAAKFPQDRSVISRHLRMLSEAGIVRAKKDGRHVYYDLDGPQLLKRLEVILQKARALVAICCPE